MIETTGTDDQFTEKRTWRDALASLRDRISGGDDVDPADLADTRVKADAETEVETARKARHERKLEKDAREAAAVRADELAAQIDPDCHVKGLAEAQQAWDDYQDVIIAVKARFGEHERKVNALLKAVADSGAPTVKAQSNTTEVEGDAVVTQPMSRTIPVWRGVKYGYARFSGTFLPHRAPRHKPAFEAVDRQG